MFNVMPRRIAVIVSLVFAAGLVSAAAAAAVVPSRDTAGAEESRFKEDREREKISRPRAEGSSSVEESLPAPSAADDSQKFRVNAIRISGNYSIPDKELRPFAAPLV